MIYFMGWSCYQKRVMESSGIKPRKPWLSSSRFRIRDDVRKGMAMWWSRWVPVSTLWISHVLDDPSQILTRFLKMPSGMNPVDAYPLAWANLWILSQQHPGSRLWFHFWQEADGTFFSLLSDAFANLGSSFDTASPTRTLLGPNWSKLLPLSLWLAPWHLSHSLSSCETEMNWRGRRYYHSKSIWWKLPSHFLRLLLILRHCGPS